MYSAFFRSQKQSVIASSNLSEESTLSAHSAHKFSLRVKNEDFAVLTENQHEACQLWYDTLSNRLLDVNAFGQLESSLIELPHFDARLLNGEELVSVGQIDLS